MAKTFATDTIKLTKIQLDEKYRTQPKVKVDTVVSRAGGPLKKNIAGTKPKEG